MKPTKEMVEFCMILNIDGTIDKFYKKWNKKYSRETVRSKFLKSETCKKILNKETKYWGEPIGFLCDEYEDELKGRKREYIYD